MLHEVVVHVRRFCDSSFARLHHKCVKTPAKESQNGVQFFRGRSNRKEVVAKYRKWILKNKELLNSLHELKGKTLGCFCSPKSCHGDVLVDWVTNQAISSSFSDEDKSEVDEVEGFSQTSEEKSVVR